MDSTAVLLDIYGRVPPLAQQVTKDLSVEQLAMMPKPNVNPIGWLVWHVARIQDHHVAQLLGENQIWEAKDWAQRFGLPPDPTNTGYGHSPEDVLAVRPESPAVLVEYLLAVDRRSTAMLENLEPRELDQIVDERWRPPVTMGVRLISVAGDNLQHLGQAGYLRGLLQL